jgi:hypothetical protein
LNKKTCRQPLVLVQWTRCNERPPRIEEMKPNRACDTDATNELLPRLEAPRVPGRCETRACLFFAQLNAWHIAQITDEQCGFTAELVVVI